MNILIVIGIALCVSAVVCQLNTNMLRKEYKSKEPKGERSFAGVNINYISLFMLDNHLKVNERFKINGNQQFTNALFYINENYSLRSEDSSTVHNSMLQQLLTGKYKVVKGVAYDELDFGN